MPRDRKGEKNVLLPLLNDGNFINPPFSHMQRESEPLAISLLLLEHVRQSTLRVSTSFSIFGFRVLVPWRVTGVLAAALFRLSEGLCRQLPQ